MLTLYDENDFHAFSCQPENAFHQIVKTLIHHDSTELVSNVETKIIALAHEENIWPISINCTEYRNALICSPYTTYVTYPLGELKQFSKRWIKLAILLNSAIMFVICRSTRFNQIAQINNNLNSLLKHSRQFITFLPQLTQKMIHRFPHHAVTFFRVNDSLDAELKQSLIENGYWVFPDRQVHLFYPGKRVMQRSHTKRDMALLRNSAYTVVTHDDLTIEDAKRIAELYRMLFIDKHSTLNPIYTSDYFKNAIEQRWHEYVALRNPEGKIDGFISWFKSENIMMCGPLGYDLERDKKSGMYRQLVAMCLKHANENDCIFNMGGGSDAFKSNRGSTKTVEYTAVYCKHLSWYRQIPWKIMHWVFHRFLKKIFA